MNIKKIGLLVSLSSAILNAGSYSFVGIDDLESFTSDYLNKSVYITCKRTTISEDRNGGYSVMARCKNSSSEYGFGSNNPFKIKIHTDNKSVAKNLARSKNKEKSILGNVRKSSVKYSTAKYVFEIGEVQLADNLSPRGELAELYKYGSDYTNLQRDDKEKELKGKIVEWSLPVYEVRKSGDIYRIQTSSRGGYVCTFIFIDPIGNDEENYIKQLKTGDMVHIKGKITGITMRHINIEDAILM